MYEFTFKKRIKICVCFRVQCTLLVSSFDPNQNVSISLNKTKQCKIACKSIQWFSSFYISKRVRMEMAKLVGTFLQISLRKHPKNVSRKFCCLRKGQVVGSYKQDNSTLNFIKGRTFLDQLSNNLKRSFIPKPSYCNFV
jgi:hypothetical protein